MRLTQVRPLIPALVLAASLLAACAGSSRRPPGESSPTYQGVPVEDKTVEQQTVEDQAYGPALPENSNAEMGPPPATSAPETAAPAASEPAAPPPPVAAKLCLVLGPGMAKTLAQASVLEAIHKAQIPVHCVVGSEMGAMVGALYSFSNGNANRLQWQLFKIKKEIYFNFPVISLREPKSTGRKMHEFLQGIFGDKKIEDLPIRYGTVAMDSERDTPATFDHGRLVDALSATLAMPAIFDPWKIGGSLYESGAISSPAPLDLARRLGGNFFVVVDVIDDNTGAKAGTRYQKAFSGVRNLLKLQKKEASFVIDFRLGAVGFDEFDRQGEILAAGARAAEKSVPELKAAWEKWIANPN